MIKSFPHQFKTKSGHSVIATNPADGKYTLHVTPIGGYGKPYIQEHFDQSYIGDENKNAKSSEKLTVLELEVIMAFEHEMR